MNRDISSRPWPSGVRIMAISTRMSRSPVTPSAQYSRDRAAPFELEAQLGEELDGGINVLYHDADVVHPLDCHRGSIRRPAAHGCPPFVRLPASASQGDMIASASATDSRMACSMTSSGTHFGNGVLLDLCAPLGECSFHAMAN